MDGWEEQRPYVYEGPAEPPPPPIVAPPSPPPAPPRAWMSDAAAVISGVVSSVRSHLPITHSPQSSLS
jgi:hypothetical protein